MFLQELIKKYEFLKELILQLIATLLILKKIFWIISTCTFV